MKNKKPRAVQIQNDIRNVLLKKWAPINISDESAAQVEYDGYVGGIYRLLANHAEVDQIVDHLYKIESENMGLQPTRGHLIEVALELNKIEITI